MSFLRPTGSQWRTPEFGKNLIVTSWRGITRVQRWPKARGPAVTKPEANRETMFTLVQKLIKWLTSFETEYARRAVKAHNDANTGQRGSAAIRLRDWQTQRLYGRGVAVTVDQYLTFYPAAVARDASFILDWVTYFHGQLLQRNDSEWGPIDNGTPGQVFTSNGSGAQCSWNDIPL